MDSSAPSFTAYVVARGFNISSKKRKLKKLLPKERSEINKLIIKAAEQNKYLRKYKFFPNLLVQYVVDKYGFKGLTNHYTHRKNAIQKQVEEQIAKGTKTLVVLAAGMDGLGIYIANKYPNVNCIEIDHPLTQSVKETLQNKNSFGKFPKLIPCDFEKEDFAAKLGPHLIKDEPAIFVAEGVFTYLTPEIVEETISKISKLSASRSVFILTSVVVNEFNSDFSASSETFIKQVEKRNEKFKYLPTAAEISQTIIKNGYKTPEINYFYDLQATHIPPQAIDLLKKQIGDSIIVTIKD